MMDKTVKTTRRNIAKGAAWAAPAVIATSQIPAFAASQIKPTYTSSVTFRAGNNITTACGTAQQMEVSQTSTSFIRITDIPSGSSLSGLYALYYLQLDAGTTFTRVSGSSTCWTVPVATGKTMTYNGVILREFRSNYNCDYRISSGTWIQPTANNFAFRSSCQTTRPTSRLFVYNQFVTLTASNGSTQTLAKFETMPAPVTLRIS